MKPMNNRSHQNFGPHSLDCCLEKNRKDGQLPRGRGHRLSAAATCHVVVRTLNLFYHLYSKVRGQYDGGRAGSMRGMQPPKRLYVQESLNFINRSNARRNMAAKMTQSQLVKELAEATGTNGKVAKTFVESYAAVAVRETKKNGLFVLPGIGRLVRVDRKARMGRNPATGEAIKIPAKKVVKFRVAKIVKDAIVPPKKK
jgi:DNA-binding protein HU-beta